MMLYLSKSGFLSLLASTSKHSYFLILPSKFNAAIKKKNAHYNSNSKSLFVMGYSSIAKKAL